MNAIDTKLAACKAYFACFILLVFMYLPASIRAQQPSKQILGADISWLPSMEDSGHHFYNAAGEQQDAIALLKANGFNYIRLRIFNNPRADSGYSKKGYCDLAQTKKMALRIKAAGMGFLLDFHYSDTWADPGKQYIPSAWKNLSYPMLQDSVRAFTQNVLMALKQQGTLPDMVQVGNEINHGMMWPMARINHLDTLAGLLKAGIAGVKAVGGNIKIMLHIACGGQNLESRFFVDNMLARGVQFDIIGESYYPEWHGTPADLKNNITDLAARYPQDVIVVEYTKLKAEVNDAAFSLKGKHLKGTFIWEPLRYQETIFDQDGKPNELLNLYPLFAQKYHVK